MKDLILPSGKTAVVRAITGRDERLFFQLQAAKRLDAFEQLIATCTENIDGTTPVRLETILALHPGDISALLLAIREISIGDFIDGEFVCGDKECRAKNTFQVDLKEVKNKPLVLEGEVPLSSGHVATFDAPTGSAQVEFRKSVMKKSKGRKITSEADIDYNALIKTRGVKIDGEPVTDETLDDLTLGDREEIIGALREIGGPDTDIELECTECGEAWKGSIEGQPRFLFPKRRG